MVTDLVSSYLSGIRRSVAQSQLVDEKNGFPIASYPKEARDRLIIKAILAAKKLGLKDRTCRLGFYSFVFDRPVHTTYDLSPAEINTLVWYSDNYLDDMKELVGEQSRT